MIPLIIVNHFCVICLKDYKRSFDLMPKYSVPKQLKQLAKSNTVTVYPNRRSAIRDVINGDAAPPNYWSQYKRTHSYLGYLRGPGEARPIADRPAYNIFTGETLKSPSWSSSENYKRISGNNILLASRVANNENILD